MQRNIYYRVIKTAVANLSLVFHHRKGASHPDIECDAPMRMHGTIDFACFKPCEMSPWPWTLLKSALRERF